MKLRYKVLGVAAALLGTAVVVLAVMLSHDSPCGSAPAVAGGAATMKAAVYRCYGPPEVVKLETLAKPVPEDNRVLVKVKAASLNPLDWHYMRGKPYVARASMGLGKPEDVRLGVDFAGTVEAVGKNVHRFKPGDEVFGGADGAFADYVTVREAGSLALKPANISFEQAAAVPVAAITALQALRDKGMVQSGQKVLINGASGGVGTFAVQIAKVFGAEVTAVCSTKNLALVRSIGADHAIDYTREDFTQRQDRYDLIIDNVGTHALRDYRHVLTPQGRMVIVGGPSDDPWLGPLTGVLKAQIYSPFINQKFMFFIAKLNAADLGILGDMMLHGKLVPVIDRRYPLDEAPAAIRYLEQGHARGKVILDIG